MRLVLNGNQTRHPSGLQGDEPSVRLDTSYYQIRPSVRRDALCTSVTQIAPKRIRSGFFYSDANFMQQPVPLYITPRRTQDYNNISSKELFSVRKNFFLHAFKKD